MLEKLGKLLVSIRDLAGFTIDLDHWTMAEAPAFLSKFAPILDELQDVTEPLQLGRENPVATSYEHVENI